MNRRVEAFENHDDKSDDECGLKYTENNTQDSVHPAERNGLEQPVEHGAEQEEQDTYDNYDQYEAYDIKHSVVDSDRC